jgi:hypothetical protein
MKVMAFIALCGSAVKYYMGDVFSLVKTAFERFRLAAEMSWNRKKSARVLSREQSYVALNDLMSLRMDWRTFTKRFSETYDVNMTQFPDPLVGIMTKVKSMLALFGCAFADEVRQIAMNQLYQPKKSKPNQLELKPDAIDEAVGLRDLVMAALGAEFDLLQRTFVISYRMKAVPEFVHGIELGLLETLIPFEEFYEPEGFTILVDVFKSIVDNCVGFIENRFEKADFDFFMDQRARDAGPDLLEFVRANKDLGFEGLKKLPEEVKDSPEKRFLANVMMKQSKKSTNVKKTVGFSFYLRPP